MRRRKTAALVAMLAVCGAMTLGAVTRSAAAPPKPGAGPCKSVDSTYYQPSDVGDPPGPGVQPADAGDPGVQSRDLTFKECEKRTSSTKMTLKWTWTLHHTARLLDGSVAVYMYNCDSGKTSQPKPAMDEPKGTKQSVRTMSGTVTFSVAKAHDYRAGFAGAGDTQETGTAAVRRFNADPPDNIVPFRGLTGCF
jgi:hypothetical protein